MQQFTYTITDPIGLHARPAGLLVQAARGLSSAVTLECRGRTAPATGLLALMTLGVRQGDAVTVTVQGDGEAADREAMERFFRENL